MSWTAATFPETPVDEQRLLTVPRALLTPVSYGPIRALRRPDQWSRGAVHDADGRLVEASQRVGGL